MCGRQLGALILEHRLWFVLASRREVEPPQLYVETWLSEDHRQKSWSVSLMAVERVGAILGAMKMKARTKISQVCTDNDDTVTFRCISLHLAG